MNSENMLPRTQENFLIESMRKSGLKTKFGDFNDKQLLLLFTEHWSKRNGKKKANKTNLSCTDSSSSTISMLEIQLIIDQLKNNHH